MSEMNRQQLCAALNISESTVRRLEQQGLPFTPVGVRSKRYELEECKAWLREAFGGGPVIAPRENRESMYAAGKAFRGRARMWNFGQARRRSHDYGS